MLLTKASINRTKPLKILVGVGNYPPDPGGGGLRAHRTYKRLMRIMPLSITVLTEGGRNEPLGTTFYEDIKVIRVSKSAGFWNKLLKLISFSLFDTNGYDLVHGMGTSHVASVVASMGLILRKPIIREHTMSGDLPEGRRPSSLLCRWGFTKAKLLIAQNLITESIYLKAGISNKNICEQFY